MGPNLFVAVGHHHVDHPQLVHEHVAVGLAVHKFQVRAAAPHVVTVRGAVAVVPMPILVQHGRADALDFLVVLAHLQAEHLLHDVLRNQFIAKAVGVDAVDRQRRLVHVVQMLRVMEQVHVRQLAHGRGGLGGAGILHEAGIIRATVGQVGGFQILVHDRRAQHDAHRILAAVILLLRVIDPLQKLLRVARRVVVERLVVAEERDNHVRLGNLQVFVRINESAVARPAVHLVTGKAVIAKHNLVLRQGRLHVAFQPAVMLHAFGQRVADQHHVVALFQLDRRRRQSQRAQGEDSCQEKFLHKARTLFAMRGRFRPARYLPYTCSSWMLQNLPGRRPVWMIRMNRAGAPLK